MKINIESNLSVPRKTSSFVFWDQTRTFILILSLTCLTLTQINSQIFTFTVICMDDVIDDYHVSTNSSSQHWLEKSMEKSYLFSATAVGALIGLVPFTPLVHIIGVRNVLSLCGLFSILGTLLFPLAVSIHFYFALLCRLFQGVGISTILTVVGVIPVSWSPSTESSTYLALLSCAFQLASMIFMPISGIMCESVLGWRSIYYLFGFLTLFSFILFYCFYNDVPRLHKNVSNKELTEIEHGKFSLKKEKVPYSKIFTDPCVLFTWISFFGGNIGFVTLLLYGPTYLRDILGLDVRATGVINGIPYFLCALFKFSTGKLSDKLKFISEKTRFMSWLYFSIIGLSIGYIVMAITDDIVIAQISFGFGIVSSGLIIMASIRSLQIRCRQHVHFAVSAISFISYLAQFVSPIAVGLICPDNTSDQWSMLFIIITVWMILTNVPFIFFASETPAKYTQQKNEETIKSDNSDM